jgi:CRP/FNR family transcriptional regulator, cyclic AMP receptor protein
MRKVLYLLGQLNDDDVEWMARIGRRQRFDDGAALIRQGEPIAFLYIVLAGRLSVAYAGSGEVASVGVGEVFGEMSFVDAMPPAATVSAVSPVAVLALDKRELQRRIDADPAFGCRFYRAVAIFLSDRLRQARQQPGQHPASATDPAGELDANVLDTLDQAGARFDRLLQALMANEAAGPRAMP